MPYLPVNGTLFTRAVRLSGMGTIQEKRNFLAEGGEDFAITESNSVRRSCNAIFLDAVTDDMALEMRQCKLYLKLSPSRLHVDLFLMTEFPVYLKQESPKKSAQENSPKEGGSISSLQDLRMQRISKSHANAEQIGTAKCPIKNDGNA